MGPVEPPFCSTSRTLPVYQRQYSGRRYPAVERQQVLQSPKYRYQTQDPVARHVYRQHGPQGKGEGQEKGQGHKK